MRSGDIPVFHAVVPAAGTGSRMGTGTPKQHLPVAGRPMIDHGIAALLSDSRISTVHVAVAPGDERGVGASLGTAQGAQVRVHGCGQHSRAVTVLAAARIAAGKGAQWLVVHDAARPCVHPEDVSRLLDVATESGGPAILASRVSDTIKLAEGDKVARTISREDKWLAQTPQVAPAPMLIRALASSSDALDEAQALERAGVFPRLVEASHPNPKVTMKADLALAEALLAPNSS